MNIRSQELSGTSGEHYMLHQMSASSGLSANILSLGASIQKISLPGSGKISSSVAMGFPDIALYEDCICYAGATLGPNAGRIKNGELPINGRVFHLSQNEQKNQLHGGEHSLSVCNWKTEALFSAEHFSRVLLSAFQPDGLDGYPGNRRYYASFTLEDSGYLTVEYLCFTDAPTYINLSNHTYWNLSGNFTSSDPKEELQIFSDSVCLNNRENLPVTIIPVEGTCFDFRSPSPVFSDKHRMLSSACREQLSIGKGYNNAFLLNEPCTKAQPQKKNIKTACILRDKETGRSLKMMTNAPALVLYSGGFLPEGCHLHDTAVSHPSCAIALEAQDLPDVMHLKPDQLCLTTPDAPFYRIIQFFIC